MPTADRWQMIREAGGHVWGLVCRIPSLHLCIFFLAFLQREVTVDLCSDHKHRLVCSSSASWLVLAPPTFIPTCRRRGRALTDHADSNMLHFLCVGPNTTWSSKKRLFFYFPSVHVSSQFIPGYVRWMCVSECVESPRRQPVHLYSKWPCLRTQHNHHEFPDRISFRGSIRTQEPAQRGRFRLQTIAHSLIMVKYCRAKAATELEIKLRRKSFLHFGQRGQFGAVETQ